ncbi:tyrosine--tRNA ligase [Thermodesulfobacteriota bacterium]
MQQTVYDTLEARGFIEQVTDEPALREALQQPLTCYAGFDPTAASLHVGHLLPIMVLAHMQRAGHRPIILVGGGTALIGDPSGKNEMRQILTAEEITANAEKIQQQFSKYIDFNNDAAALLLNNAEWLVPVKYLDFLRDIGRHFSVNRMLTAESYKMRLETGLNFIEFNYMLLQAYDFLHLQQHYNCMVQLGGNDQWGNIVAGIDLTRRVAGSTVFGLTFPLITTAAGTKMGKTEKGAVWLDAAKTPPYEYYQYWINADDRDVGRFLAFFTFMDMDAVATCLAGDIRHAKEILAFEATAITHGQSEAQKARQAARNLFYGTGTDLASLPATTIEIKRLQEGVEAFILFVETGLCASRSDARRLIKDGGGYVNNMRLEAFDEKISELHLQDGVVLLRAGKKRYHKILVS